MKKDSKWAIIISVGAVAILTLLAFAFSYTFAPGSYPYVEEYKLNYSEENVIKAIDKFKSDNPKYIVSGNSDGRRDSLDLWYFVNFNIEQENMILHAWTRPIGKSATSFSLVSVEYGHQDFKRVNHDLSSSENKRIKKLFEEKILNEIRKKLKNQ